MHTIHISRQGDTISSIAYHHYGSARSKVEAILAANPRLCRQPPVLPAGLPIRLPPQAADGIPVRPTLNLWD